MTASHAPAHQVVVIGSGFGGLFGTKALRRADVEVTMVAKTTHHLFQPLLYQVATGILSEGEIAPPTREVLSGQKNAQVLLGEVTDVDLEARTVTSRVLGRETVSQYDSLIVAAGAAQSYFGAEVRAAFDIVGFDPRGVAGSTPLDCVDDAFIDEMVGADPDPDTPAEVATGDRLLRGLGRGCLARSGDLTRHMSTEEAARDMDVLRAALGQDHLLASERKGNHAAPLPRGGALGKGTQ